MNKKKKLNLKGGTAGVIQSTIDLITSTVQLGESIFKEIKEITQIKNQLANGVVQEPGTPNVMNGPPTFNTPSL